MKCNQHLKRRLLKIGSKALIFLFTINSFGISMVKDTSKLVFVSSDRSASLNQIFNLISKQTNYNFVYNEKHVYNAPEIFLKKGSITVPKLLKKALDPINLTFEFDSNTIVVRKKDEKQLQEKIVIKGIIVNAKNQPIPGVNILVKGTEKGTVSNFDGKFKISVAINNSLVFSSIGYKSKEIIVNDKKRFLTVTLQEDIAQIDEVVIVSTGYQKVNPNQVTGSFNKVDMKLFEQKMSSDIITAIEGLTPALTISANPTTGSKVLSIRGVSTLEGSTSPLIIVDGFQYNGTLESINPYDIESITLLKDAATASIYGAKSANGVIVITTKRGRKSGFELRYSRNYQMAEKPDLNYIMNRVSSSDMVKIQSNYFENNGSSLMSYQQSVETNSPYAAYNIGTKNKVIQLYLAHKEGRISQQELNNQLEILRNTDNTSDLEKLLLQNPVNSQHNLAASFGSDNFRLRTSLNYTHGNTFKRGSKTNEIKYNINSIIDFNDNTMLDLSANLLLDKSEESKDNMEDFFDLSSYERFYGASGNALPVTKPTLNLGTNSGGVFGGKDAYAIEELKQLGLLDETYYPVLDYGRSTISEDLWEARFRAQLKIGLVNNLHAKLGAYITRGSSTRKTHTDANSWEMKGIINNLTKKESGRKGALLIPLGGRMQEVREDTNSYLFRTQLEYNKLINDNHKIIFLLGSEIQSEKTTSTLVDRLGYNSRNNTFKLLNLATLVEGVSDVFMPGGSVSGGFNFQNDFTDKEDRYFSVYSNLNYSFNNTYIFSASARIDRSNLFGTDPKYRFKPFWSVAGKWNIDNESFFTPNNFVNRLSLQASYGINGNISNDYGPYDIAVSTLSGRANQADALAIQSYAVPNLRWERTNSLNIGVSSALFNDKLNISFDYYRKNTQDVLADAEADPTISGTNFVKRNDATIINNGYEIGLMSRNIHTDNFTWRSFLNLRFNKSKVDKLYRKEEYAYSIAGRVTNKLGYEPSSLFVFDWAGVNDEGNGLIRTNSGNLMAVSPSVNQGGTFNPTNLVDNDLKYAGTTIPKTVLGLTNNVEYKGFSLSFLLVYQGGHVMMRDGYNGSHVGSGIYRINKEAGLAWEKPGDEANTIVPKIGSVQYYSVVKNSTKNIIPGDFLALRDVVFSYTLDSNFLKNLKIKELTINLKGTNLYKWTKNKYNIDPETQGLGVRRFYTPKSISSGFILTF